MASWRGEAKAIIADAIGAGDVPWRSWADVDALAFPGVVCAVGTAVSAEARGSALSALAARAPAGAVVVLVDHNRPRRLVPALWAVVASPRIPGWSLRAGWRRLAYPAARELQAAGFRVVRLRLTADERVQIVIATRT